MLDSKHQFDWNRIARLILTSRALDHLEESKLVPERKVLYQFSARGHDMAQLLLGDCLTHKFDAASGYYRSRPLLLSLGLSIEDALAGPMGKSGSFSDGRDIGVVCNLPNRNSAKVLPMAGGVGTQYTPTAGWAQALQYRVETLGQEEYRGAIAVVLGGDGSVATNGFWAALTMATTLQLPMLFYIEDNAFGLSVPSSFQTPGGNIAANLASFKQLKIYDGNGAEPEEASKLIAEAVQHARSWQGPVLLRLTLPRLSGHSAQDTQAYKSEELIQKERERDPLPKFKSFLQSNNLLTNSWEGLEKEVEQEIAETLEKVEVRSEPDPTRLLTHVFEEKNERGEAQIQTIGGLAPQGQLPGSSESVYEPEPNRINMATAIRRTLESELERNPSMLIFGEDIGPKGGVHGVTLGLQEKFTDRRVFDTSLSEEGIIGRALGMAYAGLLPVPEIQFRKYADPAQEHITDCGMVRWRTANRFAAPMVIRMPGGFSKCGDPWHSMSDEVMWAHMVGWQVLMPSNAEDAVGLLRSALRSNNPSIFFEHRNLLDAASARRPYPGDNFLTPIGEARVVQAGSQLTLVSWGAMLERAESAIQNTGLDIELIDLRCINPWDRETVLHSVEKTGRCLIVHEDRITAGFGAEIAATIASEAFLSLKAPVERLAVKDIPLPYNVALLEAALPSIEEIAQKIIELLEY